MAHLLGRLAGAAAHHWKRSLLIVAVVLAGLAGLAATGGAFSDDFRTPGTESQAAYDVLKDRFPAQSGDTATLVFSVKSGTLRDGNRPAAIARTVAAVAHQPHVTSAVDPLSAKAKGQVSRDGRIAFTTVQYDQRAPMLGRPPGERLADVSATAQRAGIEVDRRGEVVDQAEQQTAPVGELIGLAVAIIVLTLVFRSAAAMLLTLLSAGIALAGGILLLTFGTRFADFPSFAPTLGVMLGLGAGIDHALLIVGC
jgi:putative drug exporter of the RND superfamily